VTHADVEVGLDYDPEPGLADNGDLEGDLTTLLQQVGMAAKAAGTALVIFIDELQYVQEPQMAALISALHRPKATSAGDLAPSSMKCWCRACSPHRIEDGLWMDFKSN